MDNSGDKLQELLGKLQDGSISPEEEQLVLKWYTQLNISDTPVWASAEEEAAIEQELRKGIEARISQKRISRVYTLYRKTWWGAAAVIVTAVSVWFFQRTIIHQKQATNNVSLTWTVIDNNTTSVRKITLPDSSIAWLNVASHLRYNNQFGKNNRLLYAQGEILLDVQHDDSKPFRVITQNITTTVMGTLFNIEAYPDEREIRVSLLQGKIKIADKTAGERILRPGEAAISSNNNRMTVTAIRNANTVDWIKGGLVFNETLLTDALNRIEKKYRIQFIYTPGLLSTERITSVVPVTANWEAVLESMLFIHNIRFKRTNKVIQLYR